MFQAQIPLTLWVEAFMTATYLINLMHLSIVSMKSPYEKLFKKAPDYKQLRIFGCRCFPYLRDYNKNKFEKKSLPCVFLGYNPIHKGYRCLDPDTKRVYISRHVKFDESVFPFAELSPLMNLQEKLNNEEFPSSEENNLMQDNLMPSNSSSLLPRCCLESCERPTIVESMDISKVVMTPNLPSRAEKGNSKGNNSSEDTRENVSNTSKEIVIQPIAMPTQPQNLIEITNHDFPDISNRLSIELPIQPVNALSQTKATTNNQPVTSTETITNTHPMVTRHKLKNNPSLALQTSITTEPKTLKSALKYPQWVTAMNEELQALN